MYLKYPWQHDKFSFEIMACLVHLFKKYVGYRIVGMFRILEPPAGEGTGLYFIVLESVNIFRYSSAYW